ncbi:MFS-type transporter SLC18B1-like isoform X2 [Physella acuta]|nr:MFS-type transporter SLC18B1-like isoform X2 [Physella acuta]XP_059154913.1 MFS-type transporter SLC18B1-like isoform X2 [Physella acuta]
MNEAGCNESTPLLSGSQASGSKCPSTTEDEVDGGIIFKSPPIIKSDDDSGSHSNVETEAKLKFKQLSHRNKIVLALLSLANFFVGCGFSLLAPFFPQEAEKKGVSTTVIGLIFSMFQLVIFVSSPVYGNFLTRLGPKFLFVSGILVGGTCAILFGTLHWCPSGLPFIIICFACRSVEALGLSAFITSSFAIISNEFPNHVATVFGLLETASGIGLMAGPALGGVLYEAGGFGLPFYVIGSLILITGAVIYFFLPEYTEIKHQRQSKVIYLLKSPMIWFASMSMIAGGIGIVFLDPTFADHLQQFDLSTVLIGLIFVIAPGLYGILSPLWGYISDTTKLDGPLIILGNFMCGVGFLFIGPSPFITFLPSKLWIIIIGLILVGSFFGTIVVPAMKCLLTGAIEIGFENNLDTYGIVAGLFNAVFSIGAFTGPMMAGALVDKIGFNYGTTVVSGINFFVMLSCSAYFLIRRLTRKAYKKDLCVRYNSTVSENQLNRESLLESRELDLNKETNQQTKAHSQHANGQVFERQTSAHV